MTDLAKLLRRYAELFEEVAGSGTGLVLTLKMDGKGAAYLRIDSADSMPDTQEWVGTTLQELTENVRENDQGMELDEDQAEAWKEY